ncbi:DUF2140 family protein, partial [Pseudomonas sp. 2822-17]|uniref:DUF2140 family protein n=1 Tax=Pseudomonas sp. 2822-17 TaxID=1712678 RepID=UPI001179ED32
MEKEVQDRIQIYLDDYVYFKMDLNIFGFDVPLEMLFVPEVTEEGNLRLLEHTFNVGNLTISSERVFHLIALTADLPDWIRVYP